MSEEARTSPDDVFVNCPFDNDYAPIFDALIFAIFACGFRPRSALEVDDGSQTRIEKLYGIIEQCRYGVHDLCRTELDSANKLPRFNMPIELGLFLGAKRYGDEHQKQKRCLILDIERYRYQKFASDLSGMDIHAHAGDPAAALECVRDWLANVSRRKLPSAALVQDLYRRFLTDLPTLVGKLGFSGKRIPYIDYENMVTTWLLETPGKRPSRSRKPK